MGVHREYGKLIAITCDPCDDEFHPEWENEEDAESDVSLGIAIAQAEIIGWEKRGHMFYCPQCVKENK
jgi:hypothetical protein